MVKMTVSFLMVMYIVLVGHVYYHTIFKLCGEEEPIIKWHRFETVASSRIATLAKVQFSSSRISI